MNGKGFLMDSLIAFALGYVVGRLWPSRVSPQPAFDYRDRQTWRIPVDTNSETWAPSKTITITSGDTQ